MKFISVGLILRWAQRKRTANVLSCVALRFAFLLACLMAASAFFLILLVDGVAQVPPGTPPKPKTNDANAKSNSGSNSNSNSEEGAVIERILNRVRFENDGTELSETEAVVHIQSQAGVEEFGQMVFRVFVGHREIGGRLCAGAQAGRSPGGHARFDRSGFRSRGAQGSADV